MQHSSFFKQFSNLKFSSETEPQRYSLQITFFPFLNTITTSYSSESPTADSELYEAVIVFQKGKKVINDWLSG